MRALWSQMEEAWRDTLVHRAEGGAFRRQGVLHGIEHPEAEISEVHWRGVLHTLAYGRRGTFQDTYRALEYAFAADNRVIPGYVDSADPLWLVANDPTAWGNGDQLVNRLVRVGDKLLFTVERDGARMKVAPVATLFWDKPAWVHSGVESFTFTVLPYVVHIRQPGRVTGADDYSSGEECLVEVIYFEQDDTTIPVTYLIEPDDYGTPGAGEGDPPIDPGTVGTPAGIPVRGQALADETVVGYPDTTGPFPLYAYDGTAFPAATKQLSRTLAASVELRVLFNPPL